ncbi:MAG: metal ABC transporter permease [Janthinobacterium sp.]|jgi:ABC-type Mn2+/Zn2+ transport system permease subunit
MILEYLQYPFIQRAFVAGIVLALLFAILGTYVILRQMAFWGDGIAHASLAGIALALYTGFNPLLVAVIVSIIFAILIFILERKTNLSNDALIGVLFTSFMALGVVILSLNKGYQPELLSFLFGNILAIGTFDLFIIISLGALIIIFLLIFQKQLSLLLFDRTSAYLAGIKTGRLELVYYIVLAVSVVLGVKMLGVVLVSALLILPASIAKLLAASFSSLRNISIFVAEFIVIVGMIVSLYFNLPTGPSIILTGSIIFVLINLLKIKLLVKK